MAFGTSKDSIEKTESQAVARTTTTRFWKTSLVGIESSRLGDSIAVKITRIGAEIKKMRFLTSR